VLRFQVHPIVAVLVLGFLFIHFAIGFGIVQDYHDQESMIQLTGFLAQGVEAGCIILQADDGSLYNLLNVTLRYPFGTRVLVRGYIENNVATTCMQGTPFRVVEIEPVSVQSSVATIPLTETPASASRTTSASTPASSTSTPGIPLPWESTIAGMIVGLTAVTIMRRHDRMKRR
jgi:hypothetical protein